MLRAVRPEGAPPSGRLPAPLWVPRVDEADAAANWFQAFLGKEGVRLVRVARHARRATDPKYGVGETAFADGFPVLVTTQASLDDLNNRLRGCAPRRCEHFRPNIHISGCGAWEEDEMRAVSFVSDTGPSAARLPLVKPCSRCSITTVDPATGEREGGGETLRVLQDFRAGGRLRRSARLHKAYYSAAKRAKKAYYSAAK